ncbi:DUF4401 domain-containing protein [Rheinheimera baltica]|uniref:DUF4401 domain-containing protein n=1 Tax=Rheinheimera baltica TaxID=67576 RepID=UPI00040BF7E4|nr:DUF4401 domain-containing protein [Rheinheimera baltica]
MNSEKILTSELLQQADIIDEAQMQQLQQHGSPWWLQILQGIAAWIASLFIISAFIGPILAVSDGSTIKAGVAVILLAGSIWLATRRQEFVQHLSVAVALAGQGLLVYTLYELFNHVDSAYACVVITALLLLSPLNQLHQRLSISIALICLLSLLHSATVVALGSNVLAAGAILLWCSRLKWAGIRHADKLKSLLEVTTLAGLCLALMGQCLPMLDLSDWLGNKLDVARALYSALGSVILISTVFWLSRFATVPSRLALITITTALCVLLYPASGLLVSTALMLACFYGGSTRWILLCLLSMLVAISQFYYQLQLNLLHKSAILALSGLVLLAAWWLLQRYQRRLA